MVLLPPPPALIPLPLSPSLSSPFPSPLPLSLLPPLQSPPLAHYTIKKVFRYFRPQAGMSLTKLSLGGNNDVIYKLFPPRKILVSDVPAGDGNIEKVFLRCNPLFPFCFISQLPPFYSRYLASHMLLTPHSPISPSFPPSFLPSSLNPLPLTQLHLALTSLFHYTDTLCPFPIFFCFAYDPCWSRLQPPSPRLLCILLLFLPTVFHIENLMEECRL
jgi:hypothetical protein